MGIGRRTTHIGRGSVRAQLLGVRSPSSLTHAAPPPASRRPTFLSTFDRESHYPIFSTLCTHLSIGEIVALTQTCRKLADLYRYLLPIQWDVDRALGHFFNDPRGFRSQMAKHDVLVWGNFVTQYFLRTVERRQQLLHVVVAQGAGCNLLCKYLLDVAGYTLQADYAPLAGCYGLVIMCRSESKTAIHLHVVTCSPIEFVLYSSGTTASLCFMSWNNAYSVFALPTFIQYKSYLLSCWDENIREAAIGDCLRGWNLQGVMWPEEKRQNHPIRERRRISDRYTWIIPFDTRQVEWSKTPDHVLEYACFNMDVSQSYDDNRPYDSQDKRVRHYRIVGKSFVHWVLKHEYFISDPQMKSFLHARCHASLILELRKLVPPQRLLRHDEARGNRDIFADFMFTGFDRPASWTYRDDEFPTWYNAFEKYCLIQQRERSQIWNTK